MKVTIEPPEVTYPYLAIWTGGRNEALDESQIANIKIHNIVVVSMVSENGDDKRPYVQSLLGGEPAHFTGAEHEYAKLPIGFKIQLTQ
jgi:hypothetical protein